MVAESDNWGLAACICNYDGNIIDIGDVSTDD